MGGPAGCRGAGASVTSTRTGLPPRLEQRGYTAAHRHRRRGPSPLPPGTLGSAPSASRHAVRAAVATRRHRNANRWNGRGLADDKIACRRGSQAQRCTLGWLALRPRFSRRRHPVTAVVVILVPILLIFFCESALTAQSNPGICTLIVQDSDCWGAVVTRKGAVCR